MTGGDDGGQRSGQSRTVRWGQAIRWHRWTRHHLNAHQLASSMLGVAEAQGVEGMPELDSLVRMIRRWERGAYAPTARYRWLLSAALDMPEGELFNDNEEDGTDRRTFTTETLRLIGSAALAAAAQDPIVQALERIHRLEGDLGDETIDSIEEAVQDMGLAHLRATADAMERQIANLLSYVESLLTDQRSDPLSRRLLSAAGWTAGLLASTQLDLGEVALARASCRAALLYGLRAHDDRLVAWARDRQAKVAYYTGDLVGVRRCVEAGLTAAPRRTGVRVGLLGAQARLLARFGDEAGCMEALRQVEEEYDELPASEVGGGLLLISEVYPAAASSAATVFLRQPEATIRRAQEVIDFFAAAPGPSRRPTRIAIAHLDIASAHAQQRRPDGACAHANEAIGSERVVSSVVVRADELAGRLMSHWGRAPEVRDLHERVLALGPRPQVDPAQA